MLMTEKIFVVVPFYNEEKLIGNLLRSFARQTDKNFHLILVNNNSTDNSANIVEKFIHNHKNISAEMILEAEKGTGYALHTGFRKAISLGANYLARTDADCEVEKNWIKKIRKYFSQGYEYIGGITHMLKDEFYSWYDPFVQIVDPYISDILPTLMLGLQNRGKEYKYFYKHITGPNMAITKDLYLRAGEFVQGSIEQQNEDFILSEKVRTLTDKVKKSYFLKTKMSARRRKTYGINKMNRYYSHQDFDFENEVVDIR